ncbi:hypothetical protein EU245_07515 [Lentibacillus lipolyticus]|nr:hypothetical protein EU245_07515 [Lentibacillus lipolyticus]
MAKTIIMFGTKRKETLKAADLAACQHTNAGYNQSDDFRPPPKIYHSKNTPTRTTARIKCQAPTQFSSSSSNKRHESL